MQTVETPVPIPNTEVKHSFVDDTGFIKAGKVDQCYHLCKQTLTEKIITNTRKKQSTERNFFMKSLTLAQDERQRNA